MLRCAFYSEGALGFLGRIKRAITDRPEPRDERPLVSVVIGSYDRAPFLREAIESVRDNGIPGGFEIIVVDGGSTDGTLPWLVEQKDVVTIVQHNRGSFRGKPVARRSWGYFMNLGFKTAEGEYVLMISDDCLLVRGAVARGLARFAEMDAAHRKVGAVAFYFRNWPKEREYYVQQTLGARLFVNHGLYRRRVLEEVGFADEESYMFYKADGDLCLKMWQAGYEVVDAPGAFVEHYEGANPGVRTANNAVLQHDREAYVRRWKGIYEMAAPDVQQRTYLAHDDAHRTAQAFERAMTAATVR